MRTFWFAVFAKLTNAKLNAQARSEHNYFTIYLPWTGDVGRGGGQPFVDVFALLQSR